jgi:lipopolysaccharide export system permease protein
VNKDNWRMLSMRQLQKSIDSMERRNQGVAAKVRNEVFVQAAFSHLLPRVTDHSKAVKPAAKTYNELLPDSLRVMVQQRAAGKASALYGSNANILSFYQQEQKEFRRHKIEWHRKISLSLACLVLFLIGAPLGSIIRKGGLGNAMIASIIFFMLFYFISNTGEKFAKEGAWSAFMGMWLSTFVLVPIGLFLTYKAIHDSQLLNKEFYTRVFRSLRKVRRRRRV